MSYPSYLIHYNKNHSKANGQFVRGDGDGDGTADEHHRYSKNGLTTKWSGDKIRSFSKNSDKKNTKLAQKYRKDLHKVWDTMPDGGKHIKSLDRKLAKGNKKAEELADKDFEKLKAEGKATDYDYDKYEKIFMNYIKELTPSGRDYTVASLLDTGYNETDANDIADFLAKYKTSST